MSRIGIRSQPLNYQRHRGPSHAQDGARNDKLDQSNSHLDLIKAELYYLNNSNVANCASHSLLQANTHHQTTHGKIDDTNTILTTQATHNTNLLAKNGSIYSELAYANNTGASGSLAHSGVQILAKNTEIDIACDLNNSRGDELYMDTHVAQISNGAIAQWALMSASGGAEIDMVGSTGYQYRSVTIYGKTTTSTARLHFAGASSSGGTFYINPTYASLQADNSSNYHFIMTWENCPFRYVDVIASVATAGLYISSIKSKHR